LRTIELRCSKCANNYMPCRLSIVSILAGKISLGRKHRTHELDIVHVFFGDVRPLVVMCCDLGTLWEMSVTSAYY
jgi:hypothetical protein